MFKKNIFLFRSNFLFRSFYLDLTCKQEFFHKSIILFFRNFHFIRHMRHINLTPSRIRMSTNALLCIATCSDTQGAAGPAYSTRVLFKTQFAFYSRRRIRISCETHLHVRENNFTARPGRACNRARNYRRASRSRSIFPEDSSVSSCGPRENRYAV